MTDAIATRQQFHGAAPRVLTMTSGCSPGSSAIARALGVHSGRDQETEIYTRIDELPEGPSRSVAHDYKIDWYGYDYPIEAKRNAIKSNITSNGTWERWRCQGRDYRHLPSVDGGGNGLTTAASRIPPRGAGGGFHDLFPWPTQMCFVRSTPTSLCAPIWRASCIAPPWLSASVLPADGCGTGAALRLVHIPRAEAGTDLRTRTSRSARTPKD
jgi:hypothetical protein